jgi:IclR family transcriptional regulator, KDG regulon repressor
MTVDKTSLLKRAVSILDCFSHDRPELGVREVSRMVGMSSSTAGRLMASMKDLGVLSQNPVSHAYSLAGKVLSWSGVYVTSLDVRNKAVPVMERLHSETLETISLYVIEGNERVCVERLESPHNVRIVARVGRRLPLYAGSAGKVFLAFMSQARRKAILDTTNFEPFTPKTFIDRIALEEELAMIRDNGYAVSVGEWILEASGVAAPIFDQNGEVLASLTISGPAQRFTPEKIQVYVSKVTSVACSISRDMGYIEDNRSQHKPQRNC